jgi:hypothetical protein
MFFSEVAASNTWQQQCLINPLVNTFGGIHSYCGLNNKPTVGQFVDALKTSIINGLALRGLCGTNCEDDGATVLDNLESVLRAPDATSPS